jgi:hypothetical protein
MENLKTRKQTGYWINRFRSAGQWYADIVDYIRKTYSELSAKIRRIANKTGHTPAAIQAILWTISRFNYGFGGSSFTAETKQTQFSFMGE